MIDENEADDSNEDDTVEFHLGLRLCDRVVFYAYFQITWYYPGIIHAVLTRPENYRHLQCWSCNYSNTLRIASI